MRPAVIELAPELAPVVVEGGGARQGRELGRQTGHQYRTIDIDTQLQR